MLAGSLPALSTNLRSRPAAFLPSLRRFGDIGAGIEPMCSAWSTQPWQPAVPLPYWFLALRQPCG